MRWEKNFLCNYNEKEVVGGGELSRLLFLLLFYFCIIESLPDFLKK